MKRQNTQPVMTIGLHQSKASWPGSETLITLHRRYWSAVKQADEITAAWHNRQSAAPSGPRALSMWRLARARPNSPRPSPASAHIKGGQTDRCGAQTVATMSGGVSRSSNWASRDARFVLKEGHTINASCCSPGCLWWQTKKIRPQGVALLVNNTRNQTKWRSPSSKIQSHSVWIFVLRSLSKSWWAAAGGATTSAAWCRVFLPMSEYYYY